MAKKSKRSLTKLNRTKSKIWIVAGILLIFLSIIGIITFFNVQRYFP